MGLPKTERQWTFKVNQSINTGVVYSDLQTVVFALYSELLAWGAVPLGCCWYNGSTWAVSIPGDGGHAGEILSADELGWRTASTLSGNKSWFVLWMPNGVQVSAMCYRQYDTQTKTYFYFSRDGFNVAGADASNRPVAADEIQVLGASSGSLGNMFENSVLPRYWHTQRTTDSFRWWLQMGGFTTFFFEAGNYSVSVAGANNYMVVNWLGGTTNADVMTSARLFTAPPTAYGHTMLASPKKNMALSLGTLGTLAPLPDYAAANLAYPLAAATSETNAQGLGYLGRIPDAWITTTEQATGTTYPANGAKTHVAVGPAMIVPWDGISTPETGGVSPGDTAQDVNVIDLNTTSIVRQNPLLVRGEP